jgi:predicted Rossmann-fold nucleotide-binding protein
LKPFAKINLGALALVAALAGCATRNSAETAALRLDCPSARAEVPNADYVGRYVGVENAIPLEQMALDIHCSDAFKAANFPKGFVTIYGSSRIREKNSAPANDAVYADIKDFAFAWTQRHGRKYPIMTGAGPGIMEAGNRGAKDAGGASVGYTTYYDRSPSGSALKPYGGDAKLALNPYVTRGLIFSSVAVREHAMIKHSAAMVIAPGGTGTEWELFQIIETLKSNQLTKVPVYLFGNRAVHWHSFEARLKDMIERKTVNKDEVAFLKYAENDEELLKQLAADLGLN